MLILDFISFKQRFKSFIEQYELRELHILSMLKTKDSEVQLNTARAEEHRKRADAEATRCRSLTTQVSTFSQTETELRSQLNIYVEKFKQVSYGRSLRIAECATKPGDGEGELIGPFSSRSKTL